MTITGIVQIGDSMEIGEGYVRSTQDLRLEATSILLNEGSIIKVGEGGLRINTETKKLEYLQGGIWKSVGVEGESKQGPEETTAVGSQEIQRGWNYVEVLPGETTVTKTVTFSKKYTDIPTVLTNNTGETSTKPETEGSFSTSSAEVQLSNITSEGFTITTNLEPREETTYIAFNWIALGGYKGADLAENFLTYDLDLQEGEIVSLEEEEGRLIGVRRSNGTDDTQVMGVVSTAPGEILGDNYGGTGESTTEGSEKLNTEGKGAVEAGVAKVVAVGLAGRVPVRVNLEGGEIEVGDYIGSSSEEGEGKKVEGGRVIGRALERYSGGGDGFILVLLNSKRTSSILGSTVDTVLSSTSSTLQEASLLGLFGILAIVSSGTIYYKKFLRGKYL